MDYARQDFEKAQYASGGSLGYVGHPGDVGNTKIEQSPFLIAASALAQSNEVCGRIEALADRLLGPEPRDATGQGVPPEAPFILRAIEQASHQTINRVYSAMRALERIERALP